MRKIPERPLTPPEPPVAIGCCCYCGDDILPGDTYWEGDEGMVHDECAHDHVFDVLTVRFVMEQLGYARKT